ncbi:hypothetical protein [Microbacterium sp.]|uniref:hypothetical protein n=1 Tax=Microbacterium sp. TaxID=51671 RepID=UPI003736FBB4
MNSIAQAPSASVGSPHGQKGIRFGRREIVKHNAFTWLGMFAIALVLAVIFAIPAPHPDGILSHGDQVFVAVIFLLGAALIGFIAIWVFTPLAWLLGKALRRVASPVVHVVCFGVLAGLVVLVFSLLDRGQPPLLGEVSLENPVMLVVLPASVAACAFGRAMAFRSRRKQIQKAAAVTVPADGPTPA